MSIAFALKRDVRLLQGLVSADESRTETLAYQIQQYAVSRPTQMFLRYCDRAYTYAEGNAAINQHANAYKRMGVGVGDVVALVMENRPEYLFHVYGLHKIGAVVSLINTHVGGDVLAHAIRICGPKHVVVGSEVWQSFAEIQHELHLDPSQIHFDADEEHPVESGLAPFQKSVAEASAENPPECAQQTLGQLAGYIYTSGTTGMPKAAKVTHYRLWRAGRVWGGAGLRYRDGDVMYNCLPLYHSNGFLLATGSAVTAGVTVALARKFSTSRFWDDVRKFDATCFIYIGELCRFLMNAQPTKRDRDHKVRVITGNGLRPDIWERFQERFGIGRVAEFYGATEGNCITINVVNRVGSVGPLMPGMVLARCDDETKDFIRGPQGFLVAAKRGESGILLGKIRPKAAFEGYNDPKATEQKILRDVFEQGDAYFNSGDLLRLGNDLHLYFMDRLGDTFRWKGENVSTFEVQEQIAKLPFMAEVNVYGVQIEGADGRAGMSSIVMADGAQFDPVAFKAHVDEVLPAYARPLFVRLQQQMAKTGTLKVKKIDLQKQGFDPTGCDGDPVYFRSPEQDAYVRLDEDMFNRVQRGEFRL